MRGTTCYDKHGIPIERGDIVKVFHYARGRKRFYMYKQCVGPDRYTEGGREYLFFSHLNFCERGDRNGPYHENPGEHLAGYEIVQSIKCDHEQRPRRKPASISPETDQ